MGQAASNSVLRSLMDQGMGKQTIFPSAARSLALNERVVIPADGTYTITLPSCAAAAGLMFYIHVPVVTGAITVAPQSDAGEDWPGNYTLDTAGDRVLLLSTGYSWVPLFVEIT